MAPYRWHRCIWSGAGRIRSYRSCWRRKRWTWCQWLSRSSSKLTIKGYMIQKACLLYQCWNIFSNIKRTSFVGPVDTWQLCSSADGHSPLTTVRLLSSLCCQFHQHLTNSFFANFLLTKKHNIVSTWSPADALVNKHQAH